MIILLILLSATLCSSQAEVYSSVASIEALVDKEMQILDILGKIRTELETQLGSIQSYINNSNKIRNSRSIDQLKNLVTNPVSAFKLVTHLVTDFRRISEQLDIQNQNVFSEELKAVQNEDFPNDGDLKGMADAFVRLQQIYKIHPTEFANGIISSTSSPVRLTARECFMVGYHQAQLGREREELRFYKSAVEWLKIARDRFTEEETVTEHQNLTLLSEILDWLHFAMYRSGDNLLKVIDVAESLIDIAPQHETAKSALELYKNELLNLTPEKRKTVEEWYGEPDAQYVFEDSLYGELCRGERKVARKMHKFQRCYHETFQNPFLLMQPVKTEVLHVDPDVRVLHDVLTSKAIESLKTSGTSYLRRAMTLNPKTLKGEVSQTRVSKTASLEAASHPVLSLVDKISGVISNLNGTISEPLQINNYGIGGHYFAHYDFFRDSTHSASNQSDRIATLMYYLSDVEAGGATVFPRINLTIYPEKGSAVFWWNLHSDGNGDERTVHAGCPVLIGTKWVANKWFRDIGQDKYRPCGLEKDSPTHEEESLLS